MSRLKAIFAIFVLTATAATANAPQPNDYQMICFPIGGTGLGTCLERSGGVQTWYWYDAHGNWGVM